MSYSESIKAPLTKSKMEKFYNGILDELSPKCRIAFDKLNLYKWNEHSFDSFKDTQSKEEDILYNHYYHS